MHTQVSNGIPCQQAHIWSSYRTHFLIWRPIEPIWCLVVPMEMLAGLHSVHLKYCKQALPKLLFRLNYSIIIQICAVLKAKMTRKNLSTAKFTNFDKTV